MMTFGDTLIRRELSQDLYQWLHILVGWIGGLTRLSPQILKAI